MKIEFDCQGNKGLIRVIGTLNLHTLKEFDQQMRNLDLSGLTNAVLDLAELDHIDSSGVSGIIQLHKMLINQKVFLRVGKISARVERLFEQMHLFEIIPRA
jgi:anti-anti-sigma factor